MENKVDVIECEGLQIAAYLEMRSLGEHSAYYPGSILFFVERGQLNLRCGKDLHIVPRDGFLLVRKFTNGQYFKTWTVEEGSAIVYAFVFQDEFVAEAIVDFKYELPDKKIEERVFHLPSNKVLRGLFQSITSYIAEQEDLDKELITLKTKEAILGIFKSSPDILAIFAQFYQSELADLETFMQHHFQLNITLKELARLSGRSLSGFNRAFKSLYHVPPHRWIMQQRLKKAKELILKGERTPKEFYMDLGFSDLAHFSRCFKKEFGKTATALSKSIS